MADDLDSLSTEALAVRAADLARELRFGERAAVALLTATPEKAREFIRRNSPVLHD